MDLMRYQITAEERKSEERQKPQQSVYIAERPESGTVSFMNNTEQSVTSKLLVREAKIVGDKIEPGVSMIIVNFEKCIVSEIGLNIQFIDEPVKNATTVYRHKFKPQDVLNPRDKREIWMPIREVMGHGETDQIKDKWYMRVKVEGYHRDCR
jgi:hypothetical protein